MTGGRWAQQADVVLRELFSPGKPEPTREQVADAYPFGERAYWPYKVWLARVKVWRRYRAAFPPEGVQRS